MQNQELIERLSTLEKKVYKLVVKANTLQKQLDTTIEENISLKETIKNQNEKLNNFQNQENFNKIVTSTIAGTESTADLKKKLDEYIASIDYCINHLSK